MATRAPRKLTVDDLEDDFIELIDGIVVREHARSFEHGDAQGSVGAALSTAFGRAGPTPGSGWWFASGVHVAYADDQRFRHDVVGWRKSRIPGRPHGDGLRPDWVCEVLSTDRAKDLHAKRRVLHTSGVPHYWIVDLEATLLTVLRHSADGYLIASTHEPGDRARIEPFDAIELEVTCLFGDIPDAP